MDNPKTWEELLSPEAWQARAKVMSELIAANNAFRKLREDLLKNATHDGSNR